MAKNLKVLPRKLWIKIFFLMKSPNCGLKKNYGHVICANVIFSIQ